MVKGDRILATTVVATAAAIGVLVGVLVLSVHGMHRVATASHDAASTDLAALGLGLTLARDVDRVYLEALSLKPSAGARGSGPDDEATSAEVIALLTEDVPAVDRDLRALALAAGEETEMSKALHAAVVTWTSFRNELAAQVTATGTAFGSATLHSRFSDLTFRVEVLTELQQSGLEQSRQQVANQTRSVVLLLAGTVAACALLFATCGALLQRHVRGVFGPAREQARFAEVLQLAQSEEEAQLLLKRQLERLPGGGQVTVLNSNNSQDRLEAVTPVPADSPLVDSLEHATPGSCLAVRSGRVQRTEPGKEALLECGVCGPCPGRALCTPLTVSGEVIGSVLVTGQDRLDGLEQRMLRNTVSQAAPVLANLRNLAIAELRAATDGLTGLPNKRSVGETFQRMLADAVRTERALSVLIIDLDHFKQLNDTLGHQVGDQVLAAVGSALRRTLRETDFAGRNGGEEFMVLLPGTTTEHAVATAERLRSSIRGIVVPGLSLDVTASIGVASYPEHGADVIRLERLADSALYVAKNCGRDRVEVAVVTQATVEVPAAEDLGVAESRVWARLEQDLVGGDGSA